MTRIVLDLTKVKPLIGKILPGETVELDLLHILNYPLQGTEISTITSLVLKLIYRDNLDRPYHEICNFYSEKDYINRLYRFIELVEILVNRQVGSNYHLVTLIGIIENTTDKLSVEAKVLYGRKYK